MAVARPLIETIIRVSAFLPALSPWERCALNLLEKNPAFSAHFYCESPDHCPSSNFYLSIRTSSQSTFELEIRQQYSYLSSDIVFLIVHDEMLNWNNATIEHYRYHGRNEFKVVVIANMSDDYDQDIRNMLSIFSALWQSGIVSSFVILKNDSVAKAFTYVPYKSDGACEDNSPVLLGDCSSDEFDSVVDRKMQIRDLNQCPLRFSILEDKPYLWYPLNGRLAEMVKELGKRMNFTVVPLLPLFNQRGGACGEEEFRGFKNDVVTGRAHIGTGVLSAMECMTLEYVGFPLTYCLGWCTPVITEDDYIYVFLVNLLQLKVWAALTLTMVAVTTFVFSLHILAKQPESGVNIMYIPLLIFAPVPLNFRAPSVRIVLAIWMWICLVIRTAYEGEMKSQNANPLGSYIIDTMDELAERNFWLCGSPGNVDLLRKTDEPSMQAVARKIQYCKQSLHSDIVAAMKQQDRSIFTVDLRCRLIGNEMSEHTLLLYPHSGGCFKTFGQINPFVMMPGSPFKGRIKELLLQFFEAGLVLKWIDSRTKAKVAKGEVKAFDFTRALPGLFVLAVGFALSLIAFFSEQLLYRWLGGKLSEAKLSHIPYLNKLFREKLRPGLTIRVPLPLKRTQSLEIFDEEYDDSILSMYEETRSIT